MEDAIASSLIDQNDFNPRISSNFSYINSSIMSKFITRKSLHSLTIIREWYIKKFIKKKLKNTCSSEIWSFKKACSLGKCSFIGLQETICFTGLLWKYLSSTPNNFSSYGRCYFTLLLFFTEYILYNLSSRN